MKTIIILLTVLILINPLNSHAEEACKDEINVKVNGLVCDFCARALEKVFGKRDDVNGINVNMNTGLVKINMKQGQTIDDTTLTKLIVDSGYNVAEILKGC
jgi:cation transport ATPase